jgi:hypothetical protein
MSEAKIEFTTSKSGTDKSRAPFVPNPIRCKLWRAEDAVAGQLVEAVILDIDFAPFLAAGDEPRVARRCILMNSLGCGPRAWG